MSDLLSDLTDECNCADATASCVCCRARAEVSRLSAMAELGQLTVSAYRALQAFARADDDWRRDHTDDSLWELRARYASEDSEAVTALDAKLREMGLIPAPAHEESER